MTARPEFSVGRPFVVAVAAGVTFDGRRYRAGELFPWKQLGITEAGIWELWLMFQVDNGAEPAVASCPAGGGAAPARASSASSAPAAASTPPRTAPAKPASAPPAAAAPPPPAAAAREPAKPAKPSKPQLNPLLVKR